METPDQYRSRRRAYLIALRRELLAKLQAWDDANPSPETLETRAKLKRCAQLLIEEQRNENQELPNE